MERRVALITGGSRGIGRAIGEQLAEEGYDLLLVAKDPARLERAANEVAGGSGVQVSHMACDVSDVQQLNSLLTRCQELQISPSTLVHSAGIFIEGSLVESDTDDFDASMAVNVRAIYHLTKAFLPLLLEHAMPRVVIVGSTAGLETYETGAVYSVSKWATRGYALNLRQELSSAGVGVTLVSLGSTLTDLWEGEDLPSNRLMPASDVGRIVRAALSLSEQTVVEEIVMRPILGDFHD